jgi:hypothetical protein
MLRARRAAATALTVFLSSLERSVTTADPTLREMLDLAYVVLTLLFFVVAAAYVSGCEWIK